MDCGADMGNGYFPLIVVRPIGRRGAWRLVVLADHAIVAQASQGGEAAEIPHHPGIHLEFDQRRAWAAEDDIGEGGPMRRDDDVGIGEQRDLDRAAGLVPFAVKLNEELVTKLQALAQGNEGGLNAVVAELLKKGMASKAK